MKISVMVLCVFINTITGSQSEQTTSICQCSNAYGYFKNIGIPEAKRLQKAAKEREYNSMLRIVGGEQADLGEFKYQAGLIISLFDEENKGVCGGSLISEQRVLTAAHCWNDGFHQGYSMVVVLGTTNVYSDDGVRQETFNVRMYPQYSPRNGFNDIALVYLLQSVTLTGNIGLVGLPSEADSEENYVGYDVIATGFGRQTADKSVPVPYDLQKVHLTVITNERCAELQERSLPTTVLCAIGADGANACEGDSGGPLVTNISRILMGITSHSTIEVNGCESGVPTTFTRVTSFLSWIRQYI